MDVDGQKGIARLYVTENIGDEHKFYLTKTEMESSDSSSQRKISDRNSSNDSNISIAELYDFVKNNNSKFESDSNNPTKFNPKPVNSALLNEDGTPRIFYHGTPTENGEFYVFDETLAKKRGGLGIRAYGKGNYFTTRKLTKQNR